MKISVKWVVYSRFVRHEEEINLKRRLCVQTVVADSKVIGSEANSIRPGCNNVWWKKHNPWTILYSVHRVDCSLRVPSDGVPSVSRSS